MDFIFYFILGKTLEIAETMCQEFTLSSYGFTRRHYPGLIGDYLLQSERNYGRVVYRSKDEVYMDQDQQLRYIYLYSFNAEEHTGDEYYERIKDKSGIWLVSFMKSTTIINIVIMRRCEA